MKKYEEEIIKEICKKYCKSKKFVILLIKICNDCKIKNKYKVIEKELGSVSKSVSKDIRQTIQHP